MISGGGESFISRVHSCDSHSVSIFAWARARFIPSIFQFQHENGNISKTKWIAALNLRLSTPRQSALSLMPKMRLKLCHIWTKENHFQSAFGIVSAPPPPPLHHSMVSFSFVHDFFASFDNHIHLVGSGIIAHQTSFNFHRRRRRFKKSRTKSISIHGSIGWVCVWVRERNKLNCEMCGYLWASNVRMNEESTRNRTTLYGFCLAMMMARPTPTIHSPSLSLLANNLLSASLCASRPHARERRKNFYQTLNERNERLAKIPALDSFSLLRLFILCMCWLIPRHPPTEPTVGIVIFTSCTRICLQSEIK